jgi:hypothetical protein
MAKPSSNTKKTSAEDPVVAVIATSPISHDGMVYVIGEEIVMLATQAKDLVLAGVAELKALAEKVVGE